MPCALLDRGIARPEALLLPFLSEGVKDGGKSKTEWFSSEFILSWRLPGGWDCLLYSMFCYLFVIYLLLIHSILLSNALNEEFDYTIIKRG